MRRASPSTGSPRRPRGRRPRTPGLLLAGRGRVGRALLLGVRVEPAEALAAPCGRRVGPGRPGRGGRVAERRAVAEHLAGVRRGGPLEVEAGAADPAPIGRALRGRNTTFLGTPWAYTPEDGQNQMEGDGKGGAVKPLIRLADGSR